MLLVPHRSWSATLLPLGRDPPVATFALHSWLLFFLLLASITHIYVRCQEHGSFSCAAILSAKNIGSCHPWVTARETVLRLFSCQWSSLFGCIWAEFRPSNLWLNSHSHSVGDVCLFLKCCIQLKREMDMCLMMLIFHASALFPSVLFGSRTTFCPPGFLPCLFSVSLWI